MAEDTACNPVHQLLHQLLLLPRLRYGVSYTNINGYEYSFLYTNIDTYGYRYGVSYTNING